VGSFKARWWFAGVAMVAANRAGAGALTLHAQNLPRRRRSPVALLFAAAAILSAAVLPAQVAQDYAVRVSGSVTKTPVPTIILSWPLNSQATGFTVHRKSWTASSWGSPIASLSGSATGYSDTAISVGTSYEYRVTSTTSGGVTAYGYLASGIEIPLVESRGKVVLIVDNTYASALASELTRLQSDLVGDGWTVLRHDVSRTASVPSVKALIKGDYDADPTQVNAVFLFGHVPVPYSGNVNPDDHPEHLGAWPADLFYGDMDGTWTDVQDFPSSVAGRQRNLAGDGKYDQSSAPSTIELEVGRVDLADLPMLGKSELDLLRQYLNKDHNFRFKLITAARRALIDDNFGTDFSAGAVSGWRSFSALFGAGNVSTVSSGNWLSTLSSQSYLWGYGSGPGYWYYATGVETTSDLATVDTQVVFTMLFGSWFGDWDSTDNLLRAQLGSTTFGLASAWSGRPYWYFHHVGVGETLGYSARLSQNNNGTYDGAYGMGIWAGLMGDPTLRMNAVAPPSGLSAGWSGGTTLLNWTPSPDAVLGYNLYRAPGPGGPYTRVNGALATGTSYATTGSLGESWAVRAVTLEASGGGSYFNSSESAFATAVPSPGFLYTVTPCRVIDTRMPDGPWGGPMLPALGTRTVTISGQCGIPSGAMAVSANVTVTGGTADGYLTVYPTGVAPLESTINYRAGQTRANNAVLNLGPNGEVIVKNGESTGSVNFLIDVTGYFR